MARRDYVHVHLTKWNAIVLFSSTLSLGIVCCMIDATTIVLETGTGEIEDDERIYES